MNEKQVTLTNSETKASVQVNFDTFLKWLLDGFESGPTFRWADEGRNGEDKVFIKFEEQDTEYVVEGLADAAPHIFKQWKGQFCHKD